MPCAVQMGASRRSPQDAEKHAYNEAKYQSVHHHPNVCKLITIGSGPGNEETSILIEFFDEDLKAIYDRMRHNGLPLLDGPHLRSVMRSILMGIRHVHMNGVVHQDLKLENVLISKLGHVAVCDFGLAAWAGQPVNEAKIATDGYV